MEIKLNVTYSWKSLLVTGVDSTIEEDVVKRHYKIVEGRAVFDYEDIDTEVLNNIERVFSDMIYYRKKEFNSLELIKQLADKLPSERQQQLLEWVKYNYEQ